MNLISLITAFWLTLYPMEGSPVWIIHDRLANDTGGQEMLIQDLDRDRWFILLLSQDEVEAYAEITPQDIAECQAEYHA